METIRAERPDMALLDVHMPGMGGMAVLAAIRDDEVLRGMRVMILGTGDRDEEAHAARLGATYYRKGSGSRGQWR